LLYIYLLLKKPEVKLCRVNSLGRITEKNNGKFSQLISKTHNEESITNCKKASVARVHSSFSINDMYDKDSKGLIEKRHYK
jgi:hypothetical protein